MKKTYTVMVSEVLERPVKVEAESQKEAEALAREAYDEEEIKIDCGWYDYDNYVVFKAQKAGPESDTGRLQQI